MHNGYDITKNKALKQDFIFFEDLFHIYYCSLLAFANKYTNDRQASEDIVQDVFMALWMKRDTINFNDPIKPYLYKATYNKSITYLNSLQENVNIDEQNIKLQLRKKLSASSAGFIITERSIRRNHFMCRYVARTMS